MPAATLISAILIALGGALLALAAVGAQRLARELRHEPRSWMVLRGLMWLFVVGYAAALGLVLRGQLVLLAELTGAVFLGGGAFVFLVVRVSRRSVAALREASTSRRYVEHLLDGLRDALVLVDEAGKVLASNRPFLDLTGYSVEELRGRPSLEVLPHTAVVVTQGAGARPRDQELIARGGAKIPVAVHFKTIEAPDGRSNLLMCVVKDRSDELQRERQLEQAVAAAEVSLQGRLRLAERVREELGGPLQALRGVTGELRDGLPTGDDLQRLRRLEDVEVALDRAIDDLANHATEAQARQVDAVEPRALLAAAGAALAGTEPRIRVRTRVAEALPARCLGRGGALGEVLSLLGQYLLSCGRPEAIEIAAEPVPGDLDHVLFRLSAQAEASDPSRSHAGARVVGASLAFASARLLVHAAGGRLWFVGDEAAPSEICFTAVLPAFAGDDAKTPAPGGVLAAAAQPVRPQPRARRGAALVVDDSAQTRMFLERLLVSAGYQVTLAGTAAECLELAASRPFDVALLDMLLPDGTGIEVLTALRKRYPQGDLTIIMISSLEEPASVASCFELGADDYLVKPVSPVILRARLSNASEKKLLHDRSQIQLARLDELLRVILPAPIARELQATNTVTPRRHEDVAVMFADVVGFTAYCEAHPPEEVLVQLQRLVAAFERLCERHGVLKIKTIGDSLMASAGLLEGDPHAVARCVDLGHDLLAEVRAHPAGWGLRIGIHVGRVVSGIVGSRQFLYDIWGDTVNTAQRIEAGGEVGRVNVSAAARAALPPDYATRRHASIEAKGKGALEVFTVGPRSAGPQGREAA